MTTVVLLSVVIRNSNSVSLPAYPRYDSKYPVVMSHFIIPEFYDLIRFEKQVAFQRVDGKADEMSWF